MPIRTKYEIFDTKHKAPVYFGYDKTMAYVEFNDRIRNPKGEIYRLQQTPEPVGAMTKSEDYLMLVYRVRKLMRQYFDRGMKHEDLIISLEHEKRLDEWNKKIEAYVNSHPDYKPQDEKSHAFFTLVNHWRGEWKFKKSYSRRKDCDQAVLQQSRTKCKQIEAEIDKYIRKELQLL